MAGVGAAATARGCHADNCTRTRTNAGRGNRVDGDGRSKSRRERQRGRRRSRRPRSRCRTRDVMEEVRMLFFSRCRVGAPRVADGSIETRVGVDRDSLRSFLDFSFFQKTDIFKVYLFGPRIQMQYVIFLLRIDKSAFSYLLRTKRKCRSRPTDTEHGLRLSLSFYISDFVK